MKEKIMKQEKGITLIALVITIIVLLILAGVAISMLSGENGILKQAGEAKTKTETASFVEKVRIATMGSMINEDATINQDQLKKELIKELEIEESEIDNIIKQDGYGGIIVKNSTKDTEDVVIINKNGNIEEMSDIDKEFQDYFDKNNLPYKCLYGYITGFDMINGETVAEFEEKLPSGYTVDFQYFVDENIEPWTGEITDKSNKLIGTGMLVQKDGKTVATTVVFGDVDCDSYIGSDDADRLLIYVQGLTSINVIMSNFQILASDANMDGKIDASDADTVNTFESGYYDVLTQDRYVDIRLLNTP